MLPNRIEYVDLIFACSLLGAIVVHVHTASKGQVLERAVRLTAPHCAFTLAQDARRFEKLEHESSLRVVPVEGFDDLVAAAPRRADRTSPATWRDAACIYSSSGTTGPAKGVALPHRALFEMTRTAQTVMDFRADDVAYTVTPLYHANAFV